MRDKFNRTFMIGMIVSLMLGVTLILSGCGGSAATLEGYVGDNEALMQEIEAFSISGMKIDVEDNTLTYTYTYEEEFDDTTAALMTKELEKAMASTGETFEEIKADLVKETGISDIVVKMIYMDSNETVLYESKY